MQLIRDELYHFYNQGNNREKIFFIRENKLYFLRKVRKYVAPHCKILAYCLMPNHFHFLLYATKDSVKEERVGALMVNSLKNGFRQLLSSYAQAINKQENRTGSLFRQRTKAKLLERDAEDYALICFNYIHQNPIRSKIVRKMEDWEFSSFRDYMGIRAGSLCDRSLAFELLDLPEEGFYRESYRMVASEKEEEELF